MNGDRLTLVTMGLPTSEQVLGNVTDVTGNGRMPGGVAIDATDPAPEQAQAAGRVDRRGLVDLQTSPLAWILLGVATFVYLNAKARRRGKG